MPLAFSPTGHWAGPRPRHSHLVVAGNRPTPDSLPQIESALGQLVAAGFPAGEAQRLLFSLGAYVGGSVLEWHEEADRRRSGVDDSELFREISDPARYPLLRAAGGRARHRRRPPPVGQRDRFHGSRQR